MRKAKGIARSLNDMTQFEFFQKKGRARMLGEWELYYRSIDMDHRVRQEITWEDLYLKDFGPPEDYVVATITSASLSGWR